MKKALFAIAAILMIGGIVAAPALAQNITPGQIPGAGQLGLQNQGPQTISGWVNVVVTVLKWFYTIIFIVAIAFILWSAFDFITSKGDATKAKAARTKLMYAIVGIAIALLSYGIVQVVQSSVSSQLTY
jgi:heme/copper-type cytochrome/quinol oxidase subunit 2